MALLDNDRAGAFNDVSGARYPRPDLPPGINELTPGTIPIRPVGTSGDKTMRLIDGLDGMLNKMSAIARELDSVVQSAAMLAQRQAMYASGGAPDSVLSGLGAFNGIGAYFANAGASMVGTGMMPRITLPGQVNPNVPTPSGVNIAIPTEASRPPSEEPDLPLPGPNDSGGRDTGPVKVAQPTQRISAGAGVPAGHAFVHDVEDISGFELLRNARSVSGIRTSVAKLAARALQGAQQSRAGQYMQDDAGTIRYGPMHPRAGEPVDDDEVGHARRSLRVQQGLAAASGAATGLQNRGHGLGDVLNSAAQGVRGIRTRIAGGGRGFSAGEGIAEGGGVHTASVEAAAGVAEGAAPEVAEAAGAGAAGAAGAALEGGAGTGLAEGLGAVAGAAAVPVAAVTLGEKSLAMAEGQREANAQYQRILGGSNLEGMRARVGAEMFRIGLTGQMGAGQAQQLYQGVLDLGFRGTEQGVAQDFGIQMWKKYGMQVRDSLQIMSTAAASGQESLTNLSNTLDKVTKSARDAHLSAAQVQQTFERNFQMFSELSNAPGTPQTLAGVTTMTAAQFGRQFQNVNFAGPFQDVTLRHMMASNLGMTYNQFMTGINAPGGQGAQLAARASDVQNQQVARTVLGSGGINSINQWMAQHNKRPGDELTPDEANELGDFIASQNQNLDESQVQAVLQKMGYNVSEGNALNFAARLFLNPNQNQENAQNLTAKQQPQIGHGAGARAGKNVGLSKPSVLGVLHHDFSPAAAGREVLHLFGHHSRHEQLTGVKKTYQQTAQKANITSPIVEQLLAQGDPNMKIRVHGPKGDGSDDRVVSLDDAIKDYYEQLVSGEATVETGQHAGSSVAEATGMQTQSGHALSQQGAHFTNDRGVQKKAGQSATQWENKNKGKNVPAGSVKIEAQPQLLQILKFTTQGGAYMTSTQAGVPPDAFPGTENLPNG